MSLVVQLARVPDDAALAVLRAALPEGVELVLGPEPCDRVEVLVEGSPRPEQLASAGLRAVIVPWAGLPGELAEMLRARPGITIHNLHHNAAATAEMAVALLLACAKLVVPLDASLRTGDWSPRYAEARSLCLEARTALVLGYGSIGKRVARACAGLGMGVLATRRGGEAIELDGVAEVHPAADLDSLLPLAEVLLVCLPHTEETDGLLGERRLALLPEGAIVVNVGRGAVLDEHALYAALTSGRLHSAGLDVWWRYPSREERHCTYPSTAPLHELPNVVLSPHRGGMTRDTERLRMSALAELLTAAARGEPIPNRVDLARGY